jgi:hypothetical protein
MAYDYYIYLCSAMYAGKGLLELNLNYFTAFPYSSNITFKIVVLS